WVKAWESPALVPLADAVGLIAPGVVVGPRRVLGAIAGKSLPSRREVSAEELKLFADRWNQAAAAKVRERNRITYLRRQYWTDYGTHGKNPKAAVTLRRWVKICRNRDLLAD